jgi:dephospho-CoA kinase
MTRVIGLTGGIGSGKSTVAHMFEKLGATVIDADRLVQEVQAPGSPVLAHIAREFGPAVLRPDGALDRDALAAVVFRDPEARQRLNAIVHPAVGAAMQARVKEAREAGARLVVLDIPLLLEVGGARAFGLDAVVVVYCREEQQVARQLARNGYGRDEAERRVRAQMSIEEKRRLADHVIDNSEGREATERQVRELHRRLLEE